MKQLYSGGTTSPELLRKIIAFVVTSAAIVLALTFSLLLLAVIVVGGIFALAYVGWRTRGLRRKMRDSSPDGARFEHGQMKGEVIEGEAIRVTEPIANPPRRSA